MSPDPRYPIGEYEPKPFSIEQKIEWLADLKFLPLLLENAILNLDEAQLHTPYREGGLDGSPGGASCGRQPYQCLLPV
jgi:hypothetical protein